MDSLSQLVLGSAVGEAVAGKKLKNKAVIWGGVMGTIPDLDVLLRPFITDVQELIYHRSFSHSLVFFILFSPFIGWLFTKIFPNSKADFKDWTLLAFFCFLTHALLDCFTTWGTQLFWPLSNRIAWQSIFVVDPLYTLPLLILIITYMFKKEHIIRRKLNNMALIISSSYLLFTLINKACIYNKFEEAALKNKINFTRIETRPAPLQNILWTTNIETEDGFYLGYYSWFDSKPITFKYFPKNLNLLNSFSNNQEVQVLQKMSDHLYTIEKVDSNSFIFNDLRFGQLESWNSTNSPFVFSYSLKSTNGMLDEIKRRDINNIESVGKRTISSIIKPLWQRIKGN